MAPPSRSFSSATFVAAVLAAVGAVAVLGLAVLTEPAVSGADGGVVAGLAAVRPAWLVAVAVAVTDGGSPTSMVVLLVVAVVALAWWGRSWRPAVVGAGGLAALTAVDVGTKDLVGRARPPLGLHAVAAHGYSFPSGHAMISAGVVLLLALLVTTTAPPGDRGRLLARRPAAGPVVGAVAVLVVLAVGASRVVLGVHYPSDVLAGWGLAVAVVGLVVLADRRLAPAHVGAGSAGRARVVGVGR